MFCLLGWNTEQVWFFALEPVNGRVYMLNSERSIAG